MKRQSLLRLFHENQVSSSPPPPRPMEWTRESDPRVYSRHDEVATTWRHTRDASFRYLDEGNGVERNCGGFYRFCVE